MLWNHFDSAQVSQNNHTNNNNNNKLTLNKIVFYLFTTNYWITLLRKILYILFVLPLEIENLKISYLCS